MTSASTVRRSNRIDSRVFIARPYHAWAIPSAPPFGAARRPVSQTDPRADRNQSSGAHSSAPLRCLCGQTRWRRGGSNSRPSHCERDALPAELRPRRDPYIAGQAPNANALDEGGVK